MLEITNLRGFLNSLEAAKARQNKRVTQAYKDFVAAAFQDLLMHTPQYSGQLTANWNIVISDGGDPGFVSYYRKGKTGNFYGHHYEPVSMGDGEAVHNAWDRAQQQIEKMRWNTRVRFVNADPVAPAVESNSLNPPLRPENLADGGVIMAAYVKAKYGHTSDIEIS